MSKRERPARVLVVDDKLAMAETVAEGLADRGYEARALGASREALAQLERGDVEVLVTDLRMPELDGLALVEASRKADPERPVIVMTAFGAIDSAVESIRRGAYHYLTKPFKIDELAIFVARAIEERDLRREARALRRTLSTQLSFQGLIGRSPAMQRALGVLERVARTDTPILITGETGTGKGLVARAVHVESGRGARPFISINCAALPEHLLESELFGHVKGAFTGAVADRPGLFAEADGGTLLLDELGELPLVLQAKLLQVLESRTVRPVGSSRERAVDVRLLAATHRDLRERVGQGLFREDLLYRLDVISVHLPPLRQRREDLSALLDHFLADAKKRHPTSPVERFSREALARLIDHPWPGNVRELAHTIERCVLLSAGPEVQASDLPPAILLEGKMLGAPFTREIVPIREMQRQYARWVYAEVGGHRARAAELLGVDVKTLARWLADDSGPPVTAAARQP